jgi:hypothetical protein
MLKKLIKENKWLMLIGLIALCLVGWNLYKNLQNSETFANMLDQAQLLKLQETPANKTSSIADKTTRMPNPSDSQDVVLLSAGDSIQLNIPVSKNTSYAFEMWKTGDLNYNFEPSVLNNNINIEGITEKSINGVVWNQISLQFTTTNTTTQIIKFIAGGDQELKTCGWNFHEILINEPEFPVPENCNTLIWRNIDDPSWSTKLLMDRTNKGNKFKSTGDNTVSSTTSPSQILGINDNFTIVCFVNKHKYVPINPKPHTPLHPNNSQQTSTSTSNNQDINMDLDYLFNIPGNNKNSVALELPSSHGSPQIVIADKLIQEKIPYITAEKHMLTLVKVGNKLNFYKNKIKLTTIHLDSSIPVIHASQKASTPVKLNDRVIGFSVFDTALSHNLINEIYDWGNKYVFGNLNDLFKSNLQSQPQPQANSSDSVNNLHPISTKSNKSNYQNQNHQNHGDGDVVIENGTYYLINGNKKEFLGHNRKNAFHVFKVNYPNRPVPSLLDPHKPHHTSHTAPFVMKNNPTTNPACRDVNWNKNLLEQPMTNECRKAIGEYFEKNAQYEKHHSLARAWHPSMKHNKKSAKIRRYFYSNKTCTPHQFEMHEHPDYHKYIRKDKIPCAGCAL